MGLLHTLKSKLRSSEKFEDEDGFTLIELVIVVAIIGILTSIAIPTFGSIQENARIGTGETTAKNTYAALVTVKQGLDSEMTPAKVLEKANSNSDELAVSVNSDWTTESNLCVTATWVKKPLSDSHRTQSYGNGC